MLIIPCFRKVSDVILSHLTVRCIYSTCNVYNYYGKTMNIKTSYIEPTWVRGSIISSAYGYTSDSIAKKRQRGHWQEGREWVKAPNGTMMYSPAAIEDWIING